MTFISPIVGLVTCLQPLSSSHMNSPSQKGQNCQAELPSYMFHEEKQQGILGHFPYEMALKKGTRHPSWSFTCNSTIDESCRVVKIDKWNLHPRKLTNVDPKKRTISMGNTSSNHWCLRVYVSFPGRIRHFCCRISLQKPLWSWLMVNGMNGPNQPDTHLWRAWFCLACLKCVSKWNGVIEGM